MAHRAYLLSAIRAIAWADSLPVRQAAFDDIASRKPIVRLVVRLHGLAHPGPFSAALIAAYGLKSFLAVSAKTPAPILATYVFANEKRSIDSIAAIAGGGIVAPIRYRIADAFSPRSLTLLLKALAHPKTIRRYFRFIRRIDAQLGFMPACRTASTLGLYLRYAQELRAHRPKAILTAADYSPDGLALAAAARQQNIATIYTCHSFPPIDIPRFPLRFTLSFLYAEKVAELYRRTAPITGKVVFTGIEGEYRPMRLETLKPQGMRLGIFLSGVLNIEALGQILSESSHHLAPSSILIRKHPVSLNNANIAPLVKRYPAAKTTFGTPMTQDLDECDLVVIGNSSALLQVLKYGVPAIYMPQMEDAPEDYSGFVASGIVPRLHSINDLDTGHLCRFYADEGWMRRFSAYDYNYGHPADTEAEIRAAIREVIA